MGRPVLCNRHAFPPFSCLSRDDSRGRRNDRYASPARPGVGRVETCSKRAKARPAYFHYGRQVSLFTAGHSPGVVLSRPPDKEAALLEKAFLRAFSKIPYAVCQHHPLRPLAIVTKREMRARFMYFSVGYMDVIAASAFIQTNLVGPAQLWQKIWNKDSQRVRSVVHGRPAIVGVGDQHRLAIGSGSMACVISGGTGSQSTAGDVSSLYCRPDRTWRSQERAAQAHQQLKEKLASTGTQFRRKSFFQFIVRCLSCHPLCFF